MKIIQQQLLGYGRNPKRVHTMHIASDGKTMYTTDTMNSDGTTTRGLFTGIRQFVEVPIDAPLINTQGERNANK